MVSFNEKIFIYSLCRTLTNVFSSSTKDKHFFSSCSGFLRKSQTVLFKNVLSIAHATINYMIDHNYIRQWTIEIVLPENQLPCSVVLWGQSQNTIVLSLVIFGIIYGPQRQRAVVLETVYLSLSICFWKVTSNVRLECFDIRLEIINYNLQSFGSMPRVLSTYNYKGIFHGQIRIEGNPTHWRH